MSRIVIKCRKCGEVHNVDIRTIDTLQKEVEALRQENSQLRNKLKSFYENPDYSKLFGDMFGGKR